MPAGPPRHPRLETVRRRARNAARALLPGRPPDFLIVGAQKSGTSSLFEMLSRHPGMRGAFWKEVGYFSRDIQFGDSLADYEKRFKAVPWRRPLFFEATPEYLSWPGVAERIAAAYPGIRLIAILREPVSRAYSAWNMYRWLWEIGHYRPSHPDVARRVPGNRLIELLMEGREQIRPFRDCLEIELELMRTGGAFEPALIRRGLYLDQLRAYWERFPRDRLLVLGFRELSRDPQGVMERVCRFLGAPSVQLQGDAAPKALVGSYKAPMEPEDRVLLERLYAEPNRALFEETGPLDW